ncbi:hypothetical protein SAMN02745195_00271 [Thermoanaerobacter uzonensis DSM 18761]|uniref:DUF4129 domain-containing protein n=1 Tax=Thermoanaerobacter uzonensis DSM 18761 TaxID=1123369 RepID=A0A1M4SUM8_9THEO|nr:hypothetical protein [Thermoanaerobacter uzonensis]SHE35921.1 hypothetical protein SAMN02745195_00271 [Thermoanaerobacter uzonensis DSM 18761]
MKLWDREKFVRTFLTVLDGMMVFLIYTLLNGLFIREKGISFGIILLASLISGVFNIAEIEMNEKSYKQLNLTIGVVISVLLSTIISENYYQLVALFIVFLYIWSRGVKNRGVFVNYMLNVEQFYKQLIGLFVINIANYFMPPEDILIIPKYSIIYILLSIFVLLEVKNLRFSDNRSNKRVSTFEWVAVSLIILTVILLSSPAVREFVYHYLYESIVKIFVYGASYLAYGLFLMLSKLFSLLPIDKEFFKKAMDKALRQYNNKENIFEEQIPQDYAWLAHLINGIATLLAVVIIIALIVYIIKAITRLQKEKHERDFTEEKEIDIKIGDLQIYKRLKGISQKIAENVQERVKIYRDSRERVRYYYKRFLKRLYENKILVKGNYSSEDVYKKVVEVFPFVHSAIDEITALYEKVRYGNYYPQYEEVKEFEIKLREITKNLKQL